MLLLRVLLARTVEMCTLCFFAVCSIHSVLASFGSTFGFFMVSFTMLFAICAHFGRWGSGVSHCLIHMIFVVSYRTWMLGALRPPSFLLWIALSQEIAPFRPFHRNDRMFLSISSANFFGIPLTIIRYSALDTTSALRILTLPDNDGWIPPHSLIILLSS